ncbi:MAG: DegT/DnrJ/EryC1/StrS family aminotransferase [Oligoflexia bacterium]|nr:DegT/DnrJ/EryC1/StrS family aminotransferase [Oligoflexia bacterium]
MAVSFYDFKKLHHIEMQKNILEKFGSIIEQNAFIDGKYNKLFEEDFAKFTKAKHCLLVANGTDAIELALEALDIGKGDQVGIPGITFHATAEAVLNRGATPVLVDVDPKTGLISVDSLKRILKQTYLKAIIPVHIYGMPAPINELQEVCRDRKVAIIEDAAQAHGTILSDGVPVGGSGNLTTFSFYPTKNLGAFGDAGAITTQSDELAQKLNSLRNHGRSSQGLQFFGRNSRCDHFQAAVIHHKLPELAAENDRRRNTAQAYLQKLIPTCPELHFPAQDFLQTSSWHLFPILLKSRDQKLKLKAYLDQYKIGNALFYERSLGEERPLADAAGERVHAIQFAERVICLPIHPCLSDEEVNEVTTRVREGIKC